MTQISTTHQGSKQGDDRNDEPCAESVDSALFLLCLRFGLTSRC